MRKVFDLPRLPAPSPMTMWLLHQIRVGFGIPGALPYLYALDMLIMLPLLPIGSRDPGSVILGFGLHYSVCLNHCLLYPYPPVGIWPFLNSLLLADYSPGVKQLLHTDSSFVHSKKDVVRPTLCRYNGKPNGHCDIVPVPQELQSSGN